MAPNQRCYQSLPHLVATVLFFSIAPNILAVRPSPGCDSDPETGLGSGLNPGESNDFTRNVPGTQSRTHRLTIPDNYGTIDNPPSPLVLYFHGWGGNHRSCGSRCESDAASRGFISVSLTGYGPTNWNSWNFGGSSSSPGPQGPTCTQQTNGYCDEYSNSGCDCSTADNCWWTTCWDSVGQTLAVLDEVEQDLCVDLDQIWAVGCSNGGMFTFELAADQRSASRIAGIIPIVGLPHYGFSSGPEIEGIRMMGMWGVDDTVVPPISNTDNPDKTLDTSSPGWLYTSSSKVMSDWTSGNGCNGMGQDPLDEEDWGIASYDDSLTCTLGCGEQADGVRVVGCIFEGGHVCHENYIWEPIFNFMLAGGISAPIPAPAPTAEDECTEDEDDNFLLRKENGNMNAVSRDCGWLASRNNKGKICRSKVDYSGGLGPPQNVCPITCSSCGPCFENGKTKFLKKIRKSGKPVFKTCSWLKRQANRDELCDELTSSYEGYGPPSEACHETCGVDGC